MSTADKKKKVIDQLAEDKAKSDASYSYGKDSLEPVGEGAFKGALSSSIASRVAKESKTMSKFFKRGKGETALVGIGTVAGALAGKAYNNKKVEEAKKAREWLADKRKAKDYISKTRDIYKKASMQSRQEMVGDASRVPVSALKDAEEKGLSWKDIASNAALFGVGGAAFGALAGLKPFKAIRALKLAHDVNPRMLSSAVRWGGLGSLGSLAPDIAEKAKKKVEDKSNFDNKKNKGLSSAIDGAVLFGAGSAADPLVNRFTGKYILPRADKSGSVTAEYKNQIIKADKEALAKTNKSTRRIIPKKVKPYITFGGRKAEDAREIISGVRAAKRGKSIFSGILKPTLQRGSRGAIAGAALMYGISKLQDKLSGDGMEKKASLTGEELVRAKTAESKHDLNMSRAASIAAKTGLAAAAYAIGRRALGSHSAGVNMAGLTGLYSIPKFLHEEYSRSKAKKFLSKSRNQKLLQVHKEDENKKFGTSNLVDAYIASRLVDEFITPRDIDVNVKNKSKKKFSIDDALQH